MNGHPSHVRVGLRASIVGAVGSTSAVAVLGFLSRRTQLGHCLDALALDGFAVLDDPGEEVVQELTARIVDPGPFVVLFTALALYGVARRRGVRIVAMAVLVVGSVGTSQVLKNIGSLRYSSVVAAPVDPTSFPSGHSTAMMALAVGAVFLSKPPSRWLAGVAGGSLALGQGLSMLSHGWHMPSDVVAGYFVVALWACLTSVGVLGSRRWGRVPDRLDSTGPASDRLTTLVALLVVVPVAVGLLALTGMVEAAACPSGPAGSLAAAALVALSALALPIAVAAVLRGRPDGA